MTSSPDYPTQGSSRLAQIQSLPKVDLHRHLEGSLRLETMYEIASEFRLDLPATMEEFRSSVQMVEGDERTPQKFLAKFKVIRQFFRSSEIIHRLVGEVIEDAASDGVKLLELRFTPAALRQSSGLSLEDIIDAVVTAGRKTADVNDVTLGLIVSVNRHEALELAEEVIQLTVDRMDAGILGVDLAGDEQAFAVDPFIPVFIEAKQAGLKLTIHAGEWGGPEDVAQAIEAMSADRIGHGVRSLEDPAVVQLARTSRVGFEISPTSNFQTGVFTDPETYPLSEMIDAGLRVAITTDDPSIFNMTLSDEHAFVIEQLGFSIETIKGLTLQALQLSFIDDKKRRTLEKSIAKNFWENEE